MYGGIGGGVLVDIVHHTGVDSFSAATAQGWTAGAGLYEVMSACRKLEVNLPRHTKGEPLHVVVDATGIKVYGKGEWQVTRHGWSKQRTWRKLPVGVDQANGEILAAAVITDACSDGQLLPELLDQSDADIAQVAGTAPMTRMHAIRDQCTSSPGGDPAKMWRTYLAAWQLKSPAVSSR